MSDGVHQMCFSKSGASVDEEWIVHFSRRFRHCQGGSVRKFVVVSDDKGVKRIFRIQAGAFGKNAVVHIVDSSDLFFRFKLRSSLLREDKFDVVFFSGALGDGNFERKRIFFADIIDRHLLVRDENCDGGVGNLMQLQRLKPGFERNVG